MKTSQPIGMFWFHIEWDRAGKNGIDQHGNEWENIQSPVLKDKLVEEMYVNTNIDIHEGLERLKSKLTEAERDLLTQQHLS